MGGAVACRRILFFRLKDIFVASNKAFECLRVLEAGVRSPVVFRVSLIHQADGNGFPYIAKELLRSSLGKSRGLDVLSSSWSQQETGQGFCFGR